MPKEVLHESRTDTGLTRVVKDTNGNIRIDSYFGNERIRKEHDRVSINVNTGQFSGHGYNHTDKFDSDKLKDKSKSKSK